MRNDLLYGRVGWPPRYRKPYSRARCDLRPRRWLLGDDNAGLRRGIRLLPRGREPRGSERLFRGIDLQSGDPGNPNQGTVREVPLVAEDARVSTFPTTS